MEEEDKLDDKWYVCLRKYQTKYCENCVDLVSS